MDSTAKHRRGSRTWQVEMVLLCHDVKGPRAPWRKRIGRAGQGGDEATAERPHLHPRVNAFKEPQLCRRYFRHQHLQAPTRRSLPHLHTTRLQKNHASAFLEKKRPASLARTNNGPRGMLCVIHAGRFSSFWGRLWKNQSVTGCLHPCFLYLVPSHVWVTLVEPVKSSVYNSRAYRRSVWQQEPQHSCQHQCLLRRIVRLEAQRGRREPRCEERHAEKGSLAGGRAAGGSPAGRGFPEAGPSGLLPPLLPRPPS